MPSGFMPDYTPPGSAPIAPGKPASSVGGGGSSFGGKRAPAFGKRPTTGKKIGGKTPVSRPMKGRR